MGNLINLKSLEIVSNQLTGSIPKELDSLINLKLLNLRGNHLTGTIPDEVGNLTNLKSLNLGFNQLTGTIPEQLGSLNNLKSLSISRNQLTGCIPNGLQDVLKNDFPSLDLRFCDGTAPAPPTDDSGPGDTGTTGGTLVDRYDDNDNGTIEKSEVIQGHKRLPLWWGR